MDLTRRSSEDCDSQNANDVTAKPPPLVVKKVLKPLFKEDQSVKVGSVRDIYG